MTTKSAANAYNQAAGMGKSSSQGQGQGYTAVPQPGSPTYTEAWALIEAARRMAMAVQMGPLDEAEPRKKLRETVRLNWRLWTIFQSELTIGNSNADEEIRTNMLTLCKFVDKHTIGLMAEPSPEKVAVLIDLNRNIAQGLLASLENAQEGEEVISQQAEAVTNEGVGQDV